jgi:hypothetical protein
VDHGAKKQAVRCPFGRPHPPVRRTSFSFGVADGFIDYIEEVEAREAELYWAKYNAFLDQYPTCWSRFLHWLGWK